MAVPKNDFQAKIHVSRPAVRDHRIARQHPASGGQRAEA